MLSTQSKKVIKTEALRESRKKSKNIRRCSTCGFKIRGIDHTCGEHHKNQERY